MARRPGGEAEITARITSAPGISDREMHKLAGLLEAEGSFAVVPNNGTGWRCLVQVSLRDDDRDILVAYREGLGIGHLSAVRARAGSRPQVLWSVDSKLEVELLSTLLDAHPLRGRKLAEYEIWREAVSHWAARRYGLSAAARTRLPKLASQLKDARRYRAPDANAPLPAMGDPGAPYYFAGFFSGEGSFGLARRAARFLIKLRRDDRPLLEAFRRVLGLGTICDVPAQRTWSPAAVWHVTSARDVLTGIALLETCGLLGRKRRQFDAWRPAAHAISVAKIERAPVNEQLVESARRELTRATKYAPPSKPLAYDPGHADARRAHLDVLRAWAASADGPLSCSAYEAARSVNRHWPKRDTIAFAFGSWYEALRIAGLEDRAARRPSAA